MPNRAVSAHLSLLSSRPGRGTFRCTDCFPFFTIVLDPAFPVDSGSPRRRNFQFLCVAACSFLRNSFNVGLAAVLTNGLWYADSGS